MLCEFLDDTERELVRQASEFGERYFTEENISKWYQEGGLPDDVVEAYRTSPFGYLGFSVEQGGPAVTHLGQTAILAELTRHAATIIPIQSQLLDFQIASRFANDTQLALIMNQYEETSRPCFSTAISEPCSSSDVKGYRTSVSNVGDRLLLSGEKVFVANGQHAPYTIVLAKDLTEGVDERDAFLSFWLLPANLDGVTAMPINKLGQKMLPFAALRFENVELQPEWRLGTPYQTITQTRLIMDLGRCIVCAGSLGLAYAAFEDAVRHAKARKIRNRPIGDFQQIGEMIVRMNTNIINMEGHIHNACHAFDRGQNAKLAVALMKNYVPSAAVEVADMAMQVFGGIGYTDSSRTGRIWVDSRGGQFAVGTDQIMINIASKSILASS